MLQIIHLRGADAEATRVLERWSAAHEVARVTYTDAFALCVALLRRAADVPAAVILETGAIPTDQHSILGYIGDTWPGVPTISVGGRPCGATWHCATVRDLENMLAERRPANLRITGTGSGRAVRPLRPASHRPPSLPAAPLSVARAGTETSETGIGPGNVSGNGRTVQGVEVEQPPAAADSGGDGSVLTSAELAALLGDD